MQLCAWLTHALARVTTHKGRAGRATGRQRESLLIGPSRLLIRPAVPTLTLSVGRYPTRPALPFPFLLEVQNHGMYPRTLRLGLMFSLASATLSTFSILYVEPAGQIEYQHTCGRTVFPFATMTQIQEESNPRTWPLFHTWNVATAIRSPLTLISKYHSLRRLMLCNNLLANSLLLFECYEAPCR